MAYQLRPATRDDQPAVEQLVFSVLAEYGLTPDPTSTDADLRDLGGFYHDAGGTFDVLVADSGEILGTVGLFRISPSTCELRKMYLAREARGQGLGRRLLEHALAQATALGCTRVVLETATVLREAVHLYERYGFRAYVPEHLAARCDAAYCLDLAPVKTA